jgi:NADH-quinone oxidoreductase subunit L
VLWKAVDAAGIDGLVNGVAGVARSIGGVLARIQSGSVRSYATWVVCGSILLIVTIGYMAVGR